MTPSEVLPDAGGPDQAQDRALQLVDALLHREVLEDALLDLLQAVVVLVQDLLGGGEIVADLAASSSTARSPASRCSCAPRWLRPTSATSA
jgi:hypothetical protein